MATTDRQAATLALAHALSAAERGLAVIPLSRTKLPALRSPHRDEPGAGPLPRRVRPPRPRRPRRHHRPRRVRALFAAAPWATGYGIACGRPPHHLIGIDLDTDTGPRHATPSAALRDLALRHLFTIPDTVIVLTPSGGRHLWLTGPPDVVVPNSAGRLAPGIDVRGAGGYLVGPGSVTAHGAYRLAPGTADLAPAPCPPRPAAPAHPARAPAPAHRAARPRRQQGQGLVQFVLAAHEGQRNTRLFWAACRAYENGFGDQLDRRPRRGRRPHRPDRTGGPRDDRLRRPPHRRPLSPRAASPPGSADPEQGPRIPNPGPREPGPRNRDRIGSRDPGIGSPDPGIGTRGSASAGVRPARPRLHRDRDDRPLGDGLAVLRILPPEQFHRAAPPAGLFPHLGMPVGSRPPERRPVLVIPVDQQGDLVVLPDIAQPLQVPGRFGLVIDGEIQRVPLDHERDRHHVRHVLPTHRGEPGHRRRQETLPRRRGSKSHTRTVPSPGLRTGRATFLIRKTLNSRRAA